MNVEVPKKRLDAPAILSAFGRLTRRGITPKTGQTFRWDGQGHIQSCCAIGAVVLDMSNCQVIPRYQTYLQDLGYTVSNLAGVAAGFDGLQSMSRVTPDYQAGWAVGRQVRQHLIQSGFMDDSPE